VPIILATFPSIAGVPNADLIFNIVFFVVITSVLLQGWTLTPVAKLLKLDSPLKKQIRHPIEFESKGSDENDLYDFNIAENSGAANKTIIELGMPKESLIVLISRNEQYLVPTGATMVKPGDIVLVLTNKKIIDEVRKIFD
jgi:potassium/hydrogen antiporter